LVKNLLDWPGRGNPAPYHLIECAVNLAGSRDLARRSRKSDHFVFSRHYVGSTSTGYVPTEKFRKGETSLAAAMTISGAAVSSGMGFYTSFAQSFFTTLFNLRLGNWVVNPRVYGSAVYPPYEPRLPSLLAASRLDRRFAGDVLTHNENQVFWPWYLAKEMFGATTSESPLVYLSDGGHTGDNLGLYPLLQRRCKLIIVVDAEADPYYDFGSLATAITQINADENVGVQIDLEQLRRGDRQEGGLAKTHFLLGRIRYPQYDGPAGRKASQLEHGGGDGWLIYLKSSMKAGCMPAPIISYAAFNPKFPHQSTLDQFFDDDQFEAYRSLGSHIAEEMLEAFCEWWEQQIPKGSAPAASTEVARGEHDQQPHSPDLIDTRLASLSGGQIAEVARKLIDWAANSPSQPFPATTRQPAPPKRPPPPPNPTRDEVLQALQQAQLKTGAAKSLRTSPQRLRKLCEQYGIGEKDWKNVRPPDETETSPNEEASPV
ncbi:MAG: hypothetical protein MUE50_04210, partial [Pirellulaceae bacterium]|nr:hypothetical protein [Pirellulaceae bacterium]